MAKIIAYDSTQKEEWKNIVDHFPKADVYYFPEYVQAFTNNGDGEALLLYYKSPALQAINIVMKRQVPVLQTECEGDKELLAFYDFVTPYGYGGFLLNRATKEEELFQQEIINLREAYIRYCKEQHIVAEFVRFHPVLDNANGLREVGLSNQKQDKDNLYEIEDLGNTVCLDITSTDIIWQNMTSKNRNMIRKAQKSGVKVYWGREEYLFTKFEEIYNATMDKVNAGKYYYFNKEFYESICQDLKNHALLFYAKLEDEIIAMSIVMYSKGALHYHLSASVQEYLSYAPTNLILYEAACWGSELGYQTFHLGGGLGSRQDHLYHFKKQFNRQDDCTFSVGRGIMNLEVYDRLCVQNKVDRKTGFFPAYRDSTL
ncbi:MAG TPA: GNAT family N-acetyltransferase [Lachnospiraceae bacterium]|nr:GNAT family N-acetyltransferase [Lachnospiraceae bacterium]